jgi:hypothetical protein
LDFGEEDEATAFHFGLVEGETDKKNEVAMAMVETNVFGPASCDVVPLCLEFVVLKSEILLEKFHDSEEEHQSDILVLLANQGFGRPLAFLTKKKNSIINILFANPWFWHFTFEYIIRQPLSCQEYVFLANDILQNLTLGERTQVIDHAYEGETALALAIHDQQIHVTIFFLSCTPKKKNGFPQ